VNEKVGTPNMKREEYENEKKGNDLR